MLCGGVTVYAPLKQQGCGPGKKVGIVGVGGLGHFGVLFAKALGADEVVGVSRKAAKRDESLKLGCDRYIATDDDKDWEKTNARTLDIIICTVSSEKMPMGGYLGMLKVHGTLVQVGAPDAGNLPPINAFTLLSGGIAIKGSGIGSPAEIKEMLQLAADKKIKPWIEKRPMKEANQAIQVSLRLQNWLFGSMLTIDRTLLPASPDTDTFSRTRYCIDSTTGKFKEAEEKDPL